MRDGKLRLNQSFEGKGWFRLRIASGNDVARTKLMEFRDAGGPSLTMEDYVDMHFGGVNIANVDAVNAAVFDADQAVIDSPELFQKLIFEVAAMPIDPDAAAYAELVNLESDQTMRLSGFLTDIREVGIEPVWLILGRAEFNALDGASHRAVLGPDGVLTGEFSDSPDGLVFDDGSKIYEFDNPLRGTSITEFSVIANAAPLVALNKGALVSSYSSSQRGPSLQLGSSVSGTSDQRFMGFAGSPDGSRLIQRTSAETANFVNHTRFVGGLWSDSLQGINSEFGRLLTLMNGLNPRNIPSGTKPAPLWNDNEKFRIGQRLDGADAFLGTLDFAMVTDHPITRAQWLAILNAAKKHHVATVTNPVVLWAVGDSMTRGLVGTSVPDSRSEQLVRQNSGWQGMLYENKAIGGQGIETQETLFAQAMKDATAMSEWDNWVMFWGGFNLAAEFDWTSVADREGLADRYVAMAETAAQNGISSIQWSTLITGNFDPVDDAAKVAGVHAFNDYYGARIAALQSEYPAVKMIWYDHRLTFHNNEFDTSEQNTDFFVPNDTRHLNALGQKTLVADFLSRFPSPH